MHVILPFILHIEKRKKYFSNSKIRSELTISPDHVYCMDFYDAYFDINTVALKLPGITLRYSLLLMLVAGSIGMVSP